ncbi:cytochrome P450 [Mucor mucedo]|uniref:cytochrome P450 n=1 Tax=Mucor mucedo TaxID=29922 RepID=UPI00222036CD|nr:cytochrome P450 [Mucor mucedo]KAI7895659.1 cytochrome P450 [Mucor mucedo]
MFNSTALNYAFSMLMTYLLSQFGQKYLWYNKRDDGTLKEPWAPSPKKLPFYVNAFNIFDKESYHALTRWSKEVGEIFSVKIGQKHIIVLNNVELVRDCLIVNKQLFSSKLPSDTQESILTDKCKTVFSSTFSVYWSRLRRAMYIVICGTYLSQFTQHFKAQAKKLSFGIGESLRENNTLSGKELHQLVEMVAMDTALTLVVGDSVSVPREPEAMLDLIQKVRVLEKRQSGKHNRRGQFFPSYNSLLDVVHLFKWDTALTGTRNQILEIFLPWFDPTYQKRREALAIVSEEEKQKVLLGDKLDCIAKSLLNIEPSQNDPEPVQLTKSEVLVNLIHTSLHAYTYLSATIYTLIQRLATEPELQERLFQELATEERDLAKAFVRESLRVDAPNRLLSYNSRTDYDFPVGDTKYRIDEGSPIVVNVDAIHNNPVYYPNPEKFDPDRYLKSDKKKTSLLEFGKVAGRKVVVDNLAFGAGSRMCLGLRASEGLLLSVLSQIVKQYKLKGGDVEDKVEFTTSIWSWTGRTETRGSFIEFIKR